MFWFGLSITVIFTAVFLLKMHVIWSEAHCTLGGGGAPTMDFVIFLPVFLSYGVVTILESLGMSPFPYFGFMLYFALLALTVFIHWWFDRLGNQYIARQKSFEDRADQ